MADIDVVARPKTPWWYWVIGVLGVLWSCGGAFDYLMTQTENADYMASFPPELLEYWYGMPAWLEVFWALAVWGGLLGWLLMLARSRFAVAAFLVSLVSMVINFGYSLIDGGIALQAEYMGAAEAYGFTGLIILGAIFALWFARRMRAKGVLL